jgi:hypothetical protein
MIGICSFGGAAGYMAWNRVQSPRPVTEQDVDRLTDDALAIIALLRRSGDTDDPELAINTTRVRGRLREELSGYDEARKDVIAEIIANYLRYEKNLESDMISAFERHVQGEKSAATLSATTRTALALLPERVQLHLAEDEKSLGAIDLVFENAPIDNLQDDWREMITTGFKIKASRYAAAYEDVMGRPIPIP